MKVNSIAVPAWLLAILGAFATSPDLGLKMAVGYGAQWALEGPKKVPTWVAVSVTAALAILGCVVSQGLPTVAHWQAWAASAATWALSSLGVAKIAEHTQGAPASNSIVPGPR